MLSVDEARALVLAAARPLPPSRRSLDEALGCRLAEDVRADVDAPPFDKALVDGYAVRASDLDAEATFEVVEEIDAGRVPTRTIGPGQAALIMTGAPLPAGADAIVMVEDAERSGARVRLAPSSPLQAGANVLPLGREMQRGDVVADRGSILDPIRLGVLASVGCETPLIIARPRVAILSTGDELVDRGQVPGPGQIRNSNGTLLEALVRQSGGVARPLGIVRDEPGPLRDRLALGLQTTTADMLLVSGGVSAGRRDLVPEALVDLGVAVVFHKVRLKPGKPLLFGRMAGEDSSTKTLVFGLPGNPVSVLVGYLLFVLPALAALAPGRVREAANGRGTLGRDFVHRGDRPTYHPSRIILRPDGQAVLEPLAWAGSADLRAVAEADALAVFPAGDATHRAGDPIEYLMLPGRS